MISASQVSIYTFRLRIFGSMPVEEVVYVKPIYSQGVDPGTLASLKQEVVSMLAIRGLSTTTGSVWYLYMLQTAPVALAMIPIVVIHFLLLMTNQYKPGHCSRCGYSLSHLAGEVCPECGRAIP